MGACVLTLASFPFVLRAEKKSLRGQERYAPFALLGLLLVVLLTLLRANTVGVAIRFAGAPVWDAGLHFPLRRGGDHGDGAAWDLRFDDSAHRGRLSPGHSGHQGVPWI